MKIDLKAVPSNPGVYLWKDQFGHVIYVGKAKNLSKRMKQYFVGMVNSYKTQKLVDQIKSYEYIITSTEKEALVLERNLIKKYLPHYNILLTDDKRYPYIKVNLTNRLNVSMVYRVFRGRKHEIYYGPFPNGYGARKLTNLVQRLTLYDKGIPIKNATFEEWEKRYKMAQKLLNPNQSDFINNLRQKMLDYAEQLQYEVASQIKDAINVFDAFKEKQAVQLKDHHNFDVWAIVEQDGFIAITMLFYRAGILLTKKERVIEMIESVQETMRQLCFQYYAINYEPQFIIANLLFEAPIQLVKPARGAKRQILAIAIKNAQDNIKLKLARYLERQKATQEAQQQLAHLLDIKSVYRIVMIDNSNTNNTLPTSGFVAYLNGQKQPLEYRKYRLQVNLTRKADVDYMRQGLTKYFANLDRDMPDLLIVDGGIAQINEAKKIVPQEITLMGLVKDEKHRTKFIVDQTGKKITITNRNLFNFLVKIQTEADRYAKHFHHQRRKTTMEGKLLDIAGIGPAIEAKLLNHFKTYAAVYNASLEELAQVVSPKIAQQIKERL